MHLTSLFYPWGMVLQVCCLVHFFRRRPDGYWFWIIVIGGALGSLAYIGFEVAPDAALLRGRLNQFSRRRRIHELDAVVRENQAVGNLEELADLCLEEGQFARARELYNQIITPRLEEIDPYYRRGLAALAMGDAAAAVPDLERVVKKDQKYDLYRAVGMLAQACAQAGQPDAAERWFQQAVSVSTLSETYYNYALFLAAQQRSTDAKDMAGRILAKKPTMPRFARRRERPWFRKAAGLIKKLQKEEKAP